MTKLVFMTIFMFGCGGVHVEETTQTSLQETDAQVASPELPTSDVTVVPTTSVGDTVTTTPAVTTTTTTEAGTTTVPTTVPTSTTETAPTVAPH